MYRHPLFIVWFLILLLIALVHNAAQAFSLYWLFSWLDILMHFLGGIFIGLSTLWFFFESGYVSIERNLRNIARVTAAAIIGIGIGWEIFEVVAGIPIEDNYVLDTIIDVGMDILGSFVAAYAYARVYLGMRTMDSDRQRGNQ